MGPERVQIGRLKCEDYGFKKKWLLPIKGTVQCRDCKKEFKLSHNCFFCKTNNFFYCKRCHDKGGFWACLTWAQLKHFNKQRHEHHCVYLEDLEA